MKCGGGMPSFFPVHMIVMQGCILGPSLFNICMDLVLDRVVDKSHCRASVSNNKITGLAFTEYAVIFAE